MRVGTQCGAALLALLAALSLGGCPKDEPPGGAPPGPQESAEPTAAVPTDVEGDVSPSGEFVIGPYLRDPGTTRMTVAWSARSPGPVGFHYGEGDALDRQAPEPDYHKVYYFVFDAEQSRRALRADYFYRVTLTGLRPGTRYRYRVTVNGDRRDAEFRTFPERPGPFRLAVCGDSRGNPGVYRELARSMAADGAAVLINTGDLVHSGDYEQFRAQYFEPLGGIADRVPALAARGNHDTDDALWELFFAAGVDDGSPGPPARHYSFDYLNVHVAVLDSDARDEPARTELLDWLDKDLAASTADWKLVFHHYPTYDVGLYRGDWGRRDVAPIFRRRGVDLVVAGHTHSYQRLRPMFTAGENEDRPITYMVSAGGGAPLYPVDADPHSACTFSDYHCLLLEIDGPTLTGRAIDLDGQTRDRFTISKAGGRFDAEHLASAMDESRFGLLREQVVAAMKGTRRAGPADPDGPIRLIVPVTLGPHRGRFELVLDEDSAKRFAMVPVSGQAEPNRTVEVSAVVEQRPGLPYRLVNPFLGFKLNCRIEGRPCTFHSEAVMLTLDEPAAELPRSR